MVFLDELKNYLQKIIYRKLFTNPAIKNDKKLVKNCDKKLAIKN